MRRRAGIIRSPVAQSYVRRPSARRIISPAYGRREGHVTKKKAPETGVRKQRPIGPQPHEAMPSARHCSVLLGMHIKDKNKRPKKRSTTGTTAQVRPMAVLGVS
jgi:hypothetical protein